jgi:hypothetical protein
MTADSAPDRNCRYPPFHRARRTGERDRRSDFAAPRRTSYIGSLFAFVPRSGESLPSSPDAGPARIIRKELAGNEEIPPKQICLSLAPAHIRRVLLLSDSRVSGVRPGHRGLTVGERSQRYYSTPIPGVGTSFHNLITDESQFLANKSIRPNSKPWRKELQTLRLAWTPPVSQTSWERPSTWSSSSCLLQLKPSPSSS